MDYSHYMASEKAASHRGRPGLRRDIMYYIIETNYVGPNQDQDRYVDADRIEISTSPAVTNSSHEERTAGWCGTTNDWAVYAHGEYSTLEEAREAITEIFGEVREVEPEYPQEYPEEPVVETYRPGKYEPMSAAATGDWLSYGLADMVSADTTDEQIEVLVGECVDELRSEGCEPDARVLERGMSEYRQELRDEAAE